jgi:hypothetical protein
MSQNGPVISATGYMVTKIQFLAGAGFCLHSACHVMGIKMYFSSIKVIR